LLHHTKKHIESNRVLDNVSFTVKSRATTLAHVLLVLKHRVITQHTRHELQSFIHLVVCLTTASSKASSPDSAIQSFLLQMRVSSPFLNTLRTGDAELRF